MEMEIIDEVFAWLQSALVSAEPGEVENLVEQAYSRIDLALRGPSEKEQ